MISHDGAALEQALITLFETIDLDHDGTISLKEWMSAFQAIDTNDNGVISRKQWQIHRGETHVFDAIMNKKHFSNVSRLEWVGSFESVDLDNDGRILIDEWMVTMMERGKEHFNPPLLAPLPRKCTAYSSECDEDPRDVVLSPMAPVQGDVTRKGGLHRSYSHLFSFFSEASEDTSSGLNCPRGGFRFQDARPVWEVYEQEARLGSGAFGTVYRARERLTGMQVALKMIEKKTTADIADYAMDEFSLCARATHPNIMRVFAFFDSPEAVYIASELAIGGELLDYLVKNPSLATENSIAKVSAQLMSALIFLHYDGMIHHDVKPPNILITGQHWAADPSIPVVVLSDFGTVRLNHSVGLGCHGACQADGECQPDGEFQLLGTAEYCGPEVFQACSGDRTDVYALGVTLFELLSGEKPFEQQFDLFSLDENPGIEDRFQQMRDPDFEADWTRLRNISNGGCELVKGMMAKAYDLRPSALECSRDPWCSKINNATLGANMTGEASQVLLDRLQRRARMSFYAKSLMSMMAARLSGEWLQQERELFRRLDADGTGYIDAAELRAAFEGAGCDTERAAAMMKRFDLDGSGILDINEWIAVSMYLDVGSAALQAQVRALFAQLDKNGDGAITLQELRFHFQKPEPDNAAYKGDDDDSDVVDDDDVLGAFFKELDADGDGVLSLAEFEQFWRKVV